MSAEKQNVYHLINYYQKIVTNVLHKLIQIKDSK
jgi:hypothetical protein